jgi:predicted RNA-binding protein YlxR (DUF448 family)
MVKDYRRCVSCRKVAAKSEFWRVVRSHPSKFESGSTRTCQGLSEK